MTTQPVSLLRPSPPRHTAPLSPIQPAQHTQHHPTPPTASQNHARKDKCRELNIRNLEECDIALAKLDGTDEIGPPPCDLRTLMEKRAAEGTLVNKDKVKWPESEVSNRRSREQRPTAIHDPRMRSPFVRVRSLSPSLLAPR